MTEQQLIERVKDLLGEVEAADTVLSQGDKAGALGRVRTASTAAQLVKDSLDKCGALELLQQLTSRDEEIAILSSRVGRLQATGARRLVGLCKRDQKIAELRQQLARAQAQSARRLGGLCKCGIEKDQLRQQNTTLSHNLRTARWERSEEELLDEIEKLHQQLTSRDAEVAELNAEQLANLFHETYESLAPSYGYETRPETKVFNPESPNGKLMIAVCTEVLKALTATEPKPLDDSGVTAEVFRPEEKK